MSLDYLVKLEMLIGHVLPLNCYRKKLWSFSQHLNCGSQICRNGIQLLTACGDYIAREDAQKMHHWSGRTEMTENGMG